MHFLLAQDAGLDEACGTEPGQVCETVYGWTDNETLAKLAGWVVERPLKILLILLAGLIVTRLARRFVDNFAATARRTARSAQNRTNDLLGSSAADARVEARVETITHALLGVFIVAIWSITALLVLSELDIDLAPLIAGAGIAGVALGFGAQSLVKDVISGMFMLVEDQFGVGDIVDVGHCEGTVEALELRTTKIRDINGAMWHVPNGEIVRVANKSQLWARALLDVEVAYEADLRHAQEVIMGVAQEMWADPDWGGNEIVEEPEVWGIQSLGADGVSVRVVMKTEPAKQFGVEREFRLRVKEALEREGIDIPYPQRTVWIRHEPDE